MIQIRESFIQNLKTWRKKRGISQEKLGELIDSSRGYIGDIERGASFPSPEKTQMIANALDIPVYRLYLTDEDKKNAEEAPYTEQVKDDFIRQVLDAADEFNRNLKKKKKIENG